MCSLWQHFSDGTIDFEHVTLTVTFDLHWENFVRHTFGLLITFLPSQVGLSYLACVYLMTTPFRWYHRFWAWDLDRDLWPTLGKFRLSHFWFAYITFLPSEVGMSYCCTSYYCAIIHFRYLKEKSNGWRHRHSSECPPIFVLVMPLLECRILEIHSVSHFSLTRFDIQCSELKFCIWRCFTVLQIKFQCAQFPSIFVGDMPLLECRILKIHSFPHFSLTRFDTLSWNFAFDFVLLYYRSSSSVVNFRQFL